MKISRKIIAAALIALAGVPVVSAAASAAGTCDQQGIRRNIGGLWHKLVPIGTERCGPGRICVRWLDCGTYNAF